MRASRCTLAVVSSRVASSSSAEVTMAAPSRSSRRVPTLWRTKIDPGTASTSRPCSRANSTVIRAPLRAPASTTSVPRLSPLMMRLRGGKLVAVGAVPSG